MSTTSSATVAPIRRRGTRRPARPSSWWPSSATDRRASRISSSMALPPSSATIQTKARGKRHDRKHRPLHDHRRRRHDMNVPQIPTPEAGDTPPPGDENPSQKLASASCASAVTADVTESPEGAAESDRPAEEPHRPRPAPAAVSQHQAFPSFMRRYIDMAGASGPEMDQPRPLPEAHFV